MWLQENAAKGRRPDFARLAGCGFVPREGNYTRQQSIMEGDFALHVIITADGEIWLELTDTATGEEYTLAGNRAAVGTYVGRVRSECAAALDKVIADCFVPDAFRSVQAREVVSYIGSRYGAAPEFLWEKTPDNAIFRDAASGKWYAALLTVAKRRVGLDEDGEAEVLNLKDTPERVTELLRQEGILPAYHMNKKHWYTVRLDGSIATEQIYQFIDNSHGAVRGRSKLRQ